MPFQILASSFEDAHNRMKAIRGSGNVYGKKFIEFPASQDFTESDLKRAICEKAYELQTDHE
ncbi:hypothetical protein CFPU101_49170 [Chroococcus sp. FPU101]|nr:hypothetical protein CFPU101_49170 [Chroococcus sp. FPU101]